MKLTKILTILLLTFFFHSIAKANDINTFEIEGISIGDNLLDHYSLEHINNFDKEYYPKSKKFYEQYIYWPEKGDFNIYEGMQVTGNAAVTLSRGKVVWENGETKTVRGAGRYINRPPFPPYWDALMKKSRMDEPSAVARVLPEKITE